MNGVPVLCPQCGVKSLVIKPGDKYYCLNDQCNYEDRLPTDHKFECEANIQQYRYYVRQLEQEVLKYRRVNPTDFRIGVVSGLDEETRLKLGRT